MSVSPPPLLCRLLADLGDDQTPPALIPVPTVLVAFAPEEDGGQAVNTGDLTWTVAEPTTVAGVAVQDRVHHRLWLLPTPTRHSLQGGTEVRIPAGTLRIPTETCCTDPGAGS